MVKSEVEETLERIKVQPGVEGYVICDMEGQVKLKCFCYVSFRKQE